jgi:filamentous hemagglutinin family protein
LGHIKATATLTEGAMSEMTIRGRWFLGIVLVSAIASRGNSAIAQISPDGTLPNNSNVTINGSTFNINGGTQFGQNLFHSFQQFSLQKGDTAAFNNAANIQNIFGRVTGGSVSNIDGLIRANNPANLFLINPSGIVFGPNASLNVGGSFVGTTANAIQFGTQGFFSATNREAPSPLLTINPSALVFNQIAARIENKSTQSAGVDPAGFNASGLRVRDGKSLLLVGGNVNMDGGQLNASGGRVELGGLATPGNVGLNVDGDKLSLDVPASSTRADISLTNKASVLGGNIAINARNLEVSGGSGLSAGIGQGLGSVGSQGGDITLNATGEIKVDNSGVYNSVGSQAKSNVGNINISSSSFSLINDAQLYASTSGEGNGGNINITTSGSVTFDNASYVSNEVLNNGKGNGGNTNISSGSFSLTNSAVLDNSTSGEGNAGNINITTPGSVTVDSSSVFNSVVLGQAKGNGGNINISSGSLSLTNGANVYGDTIGQGNAGNINVTARDSIKVDGMRGIGFSQINTGVSPGASGNGGNIALKTKALSIANGARVNASSDGNGAAGNVEVKAGSGSILLDNKGTISSESKAKQGGNLIVETPTLQVQNGGKITVSSPEGQAGNLTVTAGTIRLDKGSLTAETAITRSEQGANINLQGLNLLLLQNGSLISAKANGTANGGNVRIDANKGVVVAVPREDSDIIASASRGQGGNINIGTQGIFGIAEGRAIPRNGTNDIDASSQFNKPGTITINTPGVDPSRGLVQLPAVRVNIRELIASGCNAFDSGGSGFTITGRGGLPPSPDEPLSNDVIWTDTRLPAITSQQDIEKKPSAKPQPKPIVIVPATGWVFNGKGEVTLISSADSANGLGTTPTNCHSLR